MAQETSTNTIKLIDWLTCKNELIEMGFTENEITIALEKIGYTVESLTSVTDFEHEPTYTIHEKVGGLHWGDKEIVEYRKGKEWRSTERVQYQGYRVSSQYQGLEHEALVRKLFETKYPWFNQFEWEIFQIHSRIDNYEIYMKTEFGSLYVPIFAITKNNPKLIEKRMMEYWGWYREGRNFTKPNECYRMNSNGGKLSFPEYKKQQQAFYDKEIKPLQSKEYKKLLELLLA